MFDVPGCIVIYISTTTKGKKMTTVTAQHRYNLAQYEQAIKSRRLRKLAPHLVWPDGSKEKIFFNNRGWFQAGLYEVEYLDTFYIEEIWDGLLDGVTVAMRKNDTYMDDAFMAWASNP